MVTQPQRISMCQGHRDSRAIYTEASHSRRAIQDDCYEGIRPHQLLSRI